MNVMRKELIANSEVVELHVVSSFSLGETKHSVSLCLDECPKMTEGVMDDTIALEIFEKYIGNSRLLEGTQGFPSLMSDCAHQYMKSMGLTPDTHRILPCRYQLIC